MTDYSELTNNEISIEMKKMENEYEVKKQQAMNLIHEMELLDKEYLKAKDEIDKRRKGLF